jgi:hypothetical protein
MPYYRDYGWKDGGYANCRGILQTLHQPMYPTLTEDEQQFVINKVLEFLNGIYVLYPLEAVVNVFLEKKYKIVFRKPITAHSIEVAIHSGL